MAPVAADGKRRILRFLRFFGPRGDLLAAQSPHLVVYDAFGHVRLRAEVDEFLDLACVGDEIWVLTPDRLIRLSARDGRELGVTGSTTSIPAAASCISCTAPHSRCGTRSGRCGPRDPARPNSPVPAAR